MIYLDSYVCIFQLALDIRLSEKFAIRFLIFYSRGSNIAI